MKATIEANRIAIHDAARGKAVLARELDITDAKTLDATYANFKAATPLNAELSLPGAENVVKYTVDENASPRVERLHRSLHRRGAGEIGVHRLDGQDLRLRGEAAPVMTPRTMGLAVALVLSAAPVAAEDFYKGKTVNIVVGSTPSGSFDANARALARHMDRHIPGNPTVVVQNMPGAASLTAIRYIDAGAPKDGRALGVFLPGIITLSLVTPDKITLDMKNYAWVGVVSPDNYRVCYGYGPAGVKTWDDLMQRTADKPYTMGTTGKGAANFIDGQVLKEVLGANLKIIMGYPGSTEMRLSVERGELDGDCGGYNSIPRNWITDKRVHTFVRFSK